ncbi:MAG TPA: type II secretion system F family protein [Limnochordia bacterium]|nr:type II secretion system F family protein [Limnochordia bacterium]
MGKFVYKARNPRGKLVRGVVESDSREEALADLRVRGLQVTQIQAAPQSSLSQIVNRTASRKPLKSKVLALLARQLAIQLEAGVSLISSLQLLEEQSQDQRLTKALYTIRLDIASGSSFTSAIAKHRTLFPHEFIHLVEAGELAGELPTVFDHLAAYYEKMDELQKKVSEALMYPAIVGSVAVVMIFILIYFILPMLITNFTAVGAQPPKITQMVLDFRSFTVEYWYLVIGILAAVIIAASVYLRTEHGQYLKDKISLRLPVVGNLRKMVVFSRFCRTMSILLNSGISMIKALEVVERLIGNRIVNQALRDARFAVEKGQGLTEPLKQHSVFPKMLVQMVAVGEETGNLEKTLIHLSNYYDNEVNYAVSSLTKILEPAVMLVLAVVVAFIVISVYLPMMQMFSNIQF